MTKVKLGILVSGTGSNMDAIVTACKVEDYPAYVGVVISNLKGAPALQKANTAGIPAVFINPKLFESREAYDQMLVATLKEYKVQLVILAGFMRILTKDFVHAFPKRILNIHPSLLPKFPGLHAVRDALQAGAKETGTTVHFVDEGVDTGPVIRQAKVPVHAGDTEETLHERIKQEEHKLYPKAISQVAMSLES